jgi:putative DNA primase/helicase
LTPDCEWRGTFFATGNNVRVRGDLVRRTLTCRLDANVERPELRKFDRNPIAEVMADRGKYIAAALTIARAYLAMKPVGNVNPLGGFSAWSAMVREPLICLGEPDPIKSMEMARTVDPERAAAHQLINHWKIRIGTVDAVTVKEIIEEANRSTNFHALLVEQAGTPRGDAIDPKRLGMWLHKQHGKVYGGFRIDLVPRKGASNQYLLVKTEG